jgi:hypothetical protein
MENKIQSGSALGINPYCKEWSELASYLSEPGDNMLAGDFSNFDGSHKREALAFLGEQLINFIGGETDDQIVRKMLWLEITDSIHARGITVYQWVQGLPSGHTLTSVINTIMVHWLFRTATYMLIGVPEYKHEHFDVHCRLIAFGDDSLFIVDWMVFGLVTPGYLTLLFSDFGYKYTDSLKSNEWNSYDSLSKLTFLKRGFVYSPDRGLFLSPLELAVVLETPYWVRKGNDSLEVARTNVTFSLHELSMHEKAIFDKYAPIIIRYSKRKLLFLPQLTTQEEFLDSCLSQEV